LFRIVVFDIRAVTEEEFREASGTISSLAILASDLERGEGANLLQSPIAVPEHDAVVYRVAEGEDEAVRDVIAPRNPAVAVGSEVRLEGTLRTIFRDSDDAAADTRALHLADRIEPFNWTTFWQSREAE
jgi:hypothetical protein